MTDEDTRPREATPAGPSESGYTSSLALFIFSLAVVSVSLRWLLSGVSRHLNDQFSAGEMCLKYLFWRWRCPLLSWPKLCCVSVCLGKDSLKHLVAFVSSGFHKWNVWVFTLLMVEIFLTAFFLSHNLIRQSLCHWECVRECVTPLKWNARAFNY